LIEKAIAMLHTIDANPVDEKGRSTMEGDPMTSTFIKLFITLIAALSMSND
jgi:hypothetical protein